MLFGSESVAIIGKRLIHFGKVFGLNFFLGFADVYHATCVKFFQGVSEF
jgi:hypothetical protein